MSELRLEDIRHAFGDHAVLRGVTLTVEPGELVCLLGPSGCGKTTLLRLAAGLETLRQGRILIGENVVADPGHHLPPEKRGVGLMFQDYALFPHLTVLENVLFGVAESNRERRTWAERALERVGLALFARTYPHTLSGGQQQRVALVRALAPAPRLLLLDEPFSGLDVTRRHQLREATLGLLKETGVATLMVTHDPEEAMFMADRIIVMNEGHLVQTGTPFATYSHPVDAFVAHLFGPLNRLAGTVKGGRVATVLGSFPATGLAEEQTVDVLIRPEGMMIDGTGGEGTVAARVVAARLLGRTSQLTLTTGGPNGKDVVLKALVSGLFLPPPGTLLTLRVDPAQTFVFPSTGTD
jgi:iron(III) transport system ATP-binding protein